MSSLSELFRDIPEENRVYYTCPSCNSSVWVNKLFSAYKGPCEKCITKTGQGVRTILSQWGL